MSVPGKTLEKLQGAVKIAPVKSTFRRYGFGNRVAHLDERRTVPMLMTIFVILMVLWLLGVVTAYTLYGFIHILLVIAVAVLLIRVIQGRRVL